MRHHFNILAILAAAILPLCFAKAQTTKPVLPAVEATRKPELALAYDAIGSNSPAGQCGCFFLNGASVTLAVPIPFRLAAVAQVGGSHAGNVGPHLDLTLVTYLLGVRYVAPLRSNKVSLFAQGLLGVSHASGTLVSAPNPGAENAGAALAGSIGAGVDLRWRRSITFRAFEVDYQPTTFNNQVSALQNNYRLSAGLIFHR